MMKLDRSKPPQPGPITLIAFPKFITTQTAEGTPLYLVENHEQPLVSVTLYLRNGSAMDTRGNEGLAAVSAELLTKGTSSRSATEIAEQIDFVGGSLGAYASWDMTTISASVLTRYLPTALDLFADVTLNPAFANEELDRAKLQRIASIKQAKSDPGYLSETIFSKYVFASHPYSLEANGTEESIQKIDAFTAKEHYESIASPQDAFFVVAGDVSQSEIIGMLGERLKGWENKPTKQNDTKPPSLPAK